jgi:hypothetical protein
MVPDALLMKITLHAQQQTINLPKTLVRTCRVAGVIAENGHVRGCTSTTDATVEGSRGHLLAVSNGILPGGNPGSGRLMGVKA